jgi:hypothetical protein
MKDVAMRMSYHLCCSGWVLRAKCFPVRGFVSRCRMAAQLYFFCWQNCSASGWHVYMYRLYRLKRILL